MQSFSSRKLIRNAVRASVAFLIVAVAVPPAAAKSHDPQDRRREVQKERAETAATVNVLKASDADLERALDRLDENIRAQEGRAASARQAADAATQAAATARHAEESTAARLSELRGLMRRTAVEAYVRGPSQEALLPLEARSVSALATKQYMLDVAVGAGSDVADELRAAGEDLADQRAAADAAKEQAVARQREVDGQLGEVKQAHALKEQVADSVEERLERALAEADSLAALDSQLATEIARRQAALAARIASTPRGPRASRGSPRAAGSVAVTTVRGITVATEIAQQLEDLLTAAAADGFNLGGGGYRSSGGQVATRRANCGGSDYDLYEKPASHCSPPTARPGQSMHERGLAVDFTWNGGLVSSRNAAFQWLRANAGRFGLANLPSEPWHWSTNGN